MPKFVLILPGMVLCFFLAGAAHEQAPAAGTGQSFPGKPLRMFVGYPPGGGVDVAAWLVSTALSDYWGVPIVVDTADLVQLLEKPVLKGRLEEQGIDVTPSTPEQFVAHVKKETERWTRVL